MRRIIVFMITLSLETAFGPGPGKAQLDDGGRRVGRLLDDRNTHPGAGAALFSFSFPDPGGIQQFRNFDDAVFNKTINQNT